MSDVDYLDKGNSDGTILGQSSTQKIGFWGVTPRVQGTALTTELTALTYATIGTSATTVMSSTTAGYGFISTDEAQGFLLGVQNAQVRLAELETLLAGLGIIAGGTATSATDTKYDVVGSGNDDGVVMGQATSAKIGFFGITPCDQCDAITTAVTTIGVTALASTTNYDYTIATLVSNSAGFGFTDSDEGLTLASCVASLQDRIGDVETALAECGLLAGGTAIVSTTAKKYDYLDRGNTDGTIFGKSSTDKLAFWAGTPCDQPAALTTAYTTISCTAPGTASYAISTLLSTAGTFKFVTMTAARTVAVCVQNAQVRLAELESRLEECGLIAAN